MNLKVFVFQLLFSVWFIDTFTHAQTPQPCTHGYARLFDFEDATEKDCFELQGSGTLKLSQNKFKHGTNSLQWKATSSSSPALELRFRPGIPNNWLERGGVKVWFYKDSPSPGKTLTVEYRNSGNLVGRFQAILDFEGWRAVWVAFDECKLASTSLDSPTVIDEVKFVLSGADTIHIDLLQFLRSIGRQSRDKVVPPISPYGLDLYDPSNTWQHTYKWSQQPTTPLPPKIEASQIKSLQVIESRLNNWYCSETKTTPTFPSDSFLQKRWKSLSRRIDKAHQEYDLLKLDPKSAKDTGPPLFCRDCRYPEKFGDIMEKILFPLSLEYYIRSRTKEITDTVATHLNNLNSAKSEEKKSAHKAIAGTYQKMINELKKKLPTSGTVTSDQVKKAINDLNSHRLKKIENLLDYVKKQGFADGSGLGSLDHEMNKDGAGFMHSMFLLKSYLKEGKNKAKRLELINTAKWYNDFGEIYQSPSFEIIGTTADRMITLMLFRLMIVLLMPSDNDTEIKEKIRDMQALVRWMNNALAVNEGLGGVFKPDFVGHHHKAFYGSAYVPQALHTASLVHYLLGGTEFSLSSSSVNNIKRGLETMRIIAVKYSTPNSVNGRMPNYSNNLILKVLPAYAYISIPRPCVQPSGQSTVSGASAYKPEMFLRLYNDPSVNSYLEDGGYKAKYYFNSLGSLDIMDEVKEKYKGVSAESSPEGHWSKNFAALSIHRRKDWAVTVKGFNTFLWDFESSTNENVFGMFASHGALQIANNEASLKVHDVENGWDWTKVPGATTISLSLDDMKLGKGRFYNQQELAGGLTFKGTSDLENGVFGMNFEQPNYGFADNDWRRNINFRFKKSVFFVENLLVCLGSSIRATNVRRRVVQTTLFQDKLELSSKLSIKINEEVKNPSPEYQENTPSTTGQSYTTLTDTKGNFYYIPNPTKLTLKVHIQDQSSTKEDGTTSTSERYAAAWLEHDGSDREYEYAVLIPTTSYVARPADLTNAQENTQNSMKAYRVLQKDHIAHVVQFLKSPETWSSLGSPITGYVIFDRQAGGLPGPVREVSKGNCLIMAEETSEFIYLSISSPSINLDTTSTPANSDEVGQDELYQSSSREREIQVTLVNAVKQRKFVSLRVHGNPDGYKPNIKVDNGGRTVTFKNLKNGFSVEVQLIRERS